MASKEGEQEKKPVKKEASEFFEIELLFKSVKDEESRLRLAYEMFSKQNVVFKQGESKDFRTAMDEKRAGNELFSKKKNKEALQHYNAGILKCPQESDEGKELLSVLIGNRTVILFEAAEYENVLKDIAYAEHIGHYPKHIKYKLYWRKAKCHEILQNFRSAAESFEEALRCLMQDCRLNDSERLEKMKAIHEGMVSNPPKVPKAKKKIETFRDIEKFQGDKKYVAIIPKIDFKYEPRLGRYAIAMEDIPIGTLIAKEQAHAAVLIPERNLSNCQHCFASIDQPIPCTKCANVVFCSISCQQEAENTYHGVECPILESLNEYGTNKFLVLRIITQKTYSFFIDQKEKLLEHLNREGTRDQRLTKKDVYRWDDYENVMFLFRNESRRQDYDIYVYSAAVYLLRALKQTQYFPFKTNDKILFQEEVFIARLILRHCKMVNYNVHGINEIKPLENQVMLRNGMTTKFENFPIAVGLYPTLAFFNHSCEPSFIRSYMNREILARTVKPIRAGDIIYDNYGPNFLWADLEQRQKSLQFDYKFKCICEPCVEKWPCVEHLESIIKVPCQSKNCGHIFSVTKSKLKPERCQSCRRRLPPDAVTNIAGPIQRHIEAAEVLYQEGKYEEAMKTFIRILEMMYQYTNKPDLDIVRVQERIEFCMAHAGNKSNDYPH